MMRRLIFVLIFLLFLLHQDFWLWDNASLFAGLPVGLSYHIFYALVTAAMMALLVKYAWPASPDEEPPVSEERQ